MPCPLIQLDEEDIWEASLLKSAEKEPVASPPPTEEALLLSDNPEPQRAVTSAPCIPIQPEEALKPDNAVILGVITTDPLDIPGQIPLSALGTGPPTLISSLSPLEDAEPLINLPREG